MNANTRESQRGQAAVTLEQLTKTYPVKSGAGTPAVHGINLEIQPGEFMVLVGPSGCGKSTTLRMIAGLEAITSGRITIDGRAVNDVSPKDRDIAMVFQNYALYPHMSVYDNLAFGLKLRDFPRDEIDRRVREAAALLGLDALLDRRPKELSGGQRQRVAVGRAIVRQPKVFLFDEPLSNLDAQMRITTRADLSRLHARLGVTTIYVTHDQTEAMTMADRICVMKDGRIMQVATPLELYRRPANQFVAGFIGTPAMNFFRGHFQSTPAGIRFVEADAGRVQLELPPHASPAQSTTSGSDGVVLGIRPEHIAVVSADLTGDRGSTTEATVELVEPLGAETYLHLTTGGTTFIARTAPTSGVRRGEKISVRFDVERLHWFDGATGAALGR